MNYQDLCFPHYSLHIIENISLDNINEQKMEIKGNIILGDSKDFERGIALKCLQYWISHKPKF